MLTGITLIFLSLIAAPSLILAKKTNAQVLLDKVAPCQGLIGMIFTFWGIYGVIFNGVIGFDWMTKLPIYWSSLLAVNIMQLVLGFILGYGMISQYVFSKSESAKLSGHILLAKLAPIQGKLGLLGIGIGTWAILASIFFSS